MKTKHETKRKLSIISMKYDKKPKEIIIGIGVSEKLPAGIYNEVLLNTILPDTDEEYIKQHEQIKAICERMVKSWNMHDEMLEALQTFVNRVEKGEVRSKKTYAQFKELIKKATSS